MDTGFWLRIGAIWGFLAVSLGAFGAHVLRDHFGVLSEQPGGLSAERLEATFHTASQYHMYCALALLAVGILADAGRRGMALEVAGWSFLLGSLIFSGSLYILAGTGQKWLGMITPFGGVIMIIAWLALAAAAGASRKA
jgi:uncharacterized membrane protein YgdD (TMEM256/DUF423 family)